MYGVAALLVAASVPMYSYMLRHASDVRAPVPVPLPRAVAVPKVRVEAVESPYFYRYGEPLPPGYRCSGADGLVYRTRSINGSTAVEVLSVDGHQVHCGGTRVSFHD
jgi:hypothetical protein